MSALPVEPSAPPRPVSAGLGLPAPTPAPTHEPLVGSPTEEWISTVITPGSGRGVQNFMKGKWMFLVLVLLLVVGAILLYFNMSKTPAAAEVTTAPAVSDAKKKAKVVADKTAAALAVKTAADKTVALAVKTAALAVKTAEELAVKKAEELSKKKAKVSAVKPKPGDPPDIKKIKNDVLGLHNNGKQNLAWFLLKIKLFQYPKSPTLKALEKIPGLNTVSAKQVTETEAAAIQGIADAMRKNKGGTLIADGKVTADFRRGAVAAAKENHIPIGHIPWDELLESDKQYLDFTWDISQETWTQAYEVNEGIRGLGLVLGSVLNKRPSREEEPETDEGSEGFENYVPQPVKDIFDWIAGRPDMNEKSKLSLLPGYFA